MFQTKAVEKIKTHILGSIILNRAVYEIMWQNVADPDRLQMTRWRMRIECWIPKARHTLRICLTYCFSTVTMATPPWHSVTFTRTLCLSG